MTVVSIPKTSFYNGEWAGLLYGRSDFEGYNSACRLLENAIPGPLGGVKNRNGFKYVGETASSGFAVLVPFQFSITQAYVLVFTNLRMEVIYDGAFAETTGHYYITTPYTTADLPYLRFTQSADVLYITHPSYAPRKITRTGHTSWTISTITFGPSISAPTGVSSAGSGDYTYGVTAVNALGEESVLSSTVQGFGFSTGYVSWTAVSGAVYYNVYRKKNLNGAGYGLVSRTNTNYYEENVYSTDPINYDITPPESIAAFGSSNNYPRACAFFEQRLQYASTNNKPQTIFGSAIGASFDNFNYHSPFRDSDSYEFTINTQTVNNIEHIVPMLEMLLFGAANVWELSGGANTTITPNNVSIKLKCGAGCNHIRPVVVDNQVFFVSKSGENLKRLEYSNEAGSYRVFDMTKLASHLFEGKTIVSIAYQEKPDSVLWCVRSDGVLLGLSYHQEFGVYGWHRHTTQGDFEWVATIKESDGEDKLYACIKRRINGTEKRFVEMLEANVSINNPDYDVKDSFFVDSGLSLDSPKSITGITKADPGVVTSVSHGFSTNDLVDIIGVEGMTEVNNLRFKVGTTAADTFQLKDLDGNNIDTSSYSTYISGGYVRKAVSSVSGLSHLNGQEIVVLADGKVVTGLTPSSGSITLPFYASRVYAGLSYNTKIETMDFAYTNDLSVHDKLRNIISVVLRLFNTRHLSVGPKEDRLESVIFRTEEKYDDPIALFSGDKEINIEYSDPRESRIYIKNDKPLPMLVSSIHARTDYEE